MAVSNVAQEIGNRDILPGCHLTFRMALAKEFALYGAGKLVGLEKASSATAEQLAQVNARYAVTMTDALLEELAK